MPKNLAEIFRIYPQVDRKATQQAWETTYEQDMDIKWGDLTEAEMAKLDQAELDGTMSDVAFEIEQGGMGVPGFKRSVSNVGGVATPITAGEEAVFVRNLNLKLLGTGNTIHLVQTYGDLPVDVQQISTPKDLGITVGRGDVYIIQDNIHSAEMFEATIVHGLYGHIGLRALFGPALYSRMNKLSLALGDAKVAELAKKYKLDVNGYFKAADAIDISQKSYRRAGGREEVKRGWIMEELLAHIAEQETGSLKQMALEVVGAIKAWLRAKGFNYLPGLGMADIAHILKQARHEALSTQGVSDLPAFSRSANPRKTLGPQVVDTARRFGGPSAAMVAADVSGTVQRLVQSMRFLHDLVGSVKDRLPAARSIPASPAQANICLVLAP